MNRLIFSMLTAALLFDAFQTLAQSVAVNTDGSLPNNSAILDVKHTSKGVLLPRLTLVQRNQVSSPATGLLVYQTDNQPGFYFYNGNNWSPVAAANSGTKILCDFSFWPPSQIGELPANVYDTHGLFVYRGTTIDGPMNSVTAIISANRQYQFRIYDITNNKVIAETLLPSNNNSTATIVTINTINNLPVGEAIFAIQMKCEVNSPECPKLYAVQIFQ